MNKIRYTWVWLRMGRPCKYGKTITVPANRRDRKRHLKEARALYKAERWGK